MYTGIESDGQEWHLDWYPLAEPPTETQTQPPAGLPHGSTGVCVVGAEVLIVHDGHGWGLPGGRPEPGEDWLTTLHREVREEACATVLDARLLGFARGECVRGREYGRVLVRAHFSARVRLDPWEPEFEMVERRLVPVPDALAYLRMPAGYRPFYERLLAEAVVTG